MSDNPLIMALAQSLPRLAERKRIERAKQEQKELGMSIGNIFKSGGTDVEKIQDVASLFASKGSAELAVNMYSKASEIKYNREKEKARLDRLEGQDYLDAVRNNGLRMTTQGFLNAWKDGVFDSSKIKGTDLVVDTKDGSKIYESSGYVLDKDGKKVFTEGITVYKPGSNAPIYIPNKDQEGNIVPAKQPLTTEDWKARYEAKSEVQMKDYWTKEQSNVVNDFFNTYKKGINAERNESISTLSEISSSISKAPNRPATYGIITSIIARQLGKEVGALSEGDLKRVSGSQSIPARVSRAWNKMISGQALNDDDLTDFKNHISDSISIQKQFLLNDIENYSNTADAVSSGNLNFEFLKRNLSQQLDFEYDLEQDPEKRRQEMMNDGEFEEPRTLDEAIEIYKKVTGKEPTQSVIRKMKEKYGGGTGNRVESNYPTRNTGALHG